MNKQVLWIDRYKPQALNDLRGHSDAQKKAVTILNTYSTPKPVRKLILLTGPSGTGKTLLAETMAKSSRIDCVKINCSASRSFPEIKELIDPYIVSDNSSGIYGSKMVILLDEIDGQVVFKEKVNKFFDYLSKILMVNTNPFIATCNDSYRLPSYFLEHQCEVLKFQRQYDSTIRNILIDIAIKEGHKISTDDIDKLIIKGDVRASISSLQIYCMSGYVIPQIERDRNIFSETQSTLIQRTNISPTVKVEDILPFIEENGSIRATGIDRYHFYHIINQVSSLIQQYRTKESRTLLGMISYSSTYPQPTPDSTSPYVKTITPSTITKLSLTKNLRKTIKSLSLKISPDYLISSIDFFEFIFPILQTQCITDINFARHLALKYSLEPSEIALLLDSTASDPRINKILIPDKALTKDIIIPDKSTQEELEMFL